jgi:hypothetical protein
MARLLSVLDRNELWQGEVEFLITLALATSQSELAAKLATYHVHHYTLSRFEQTSYERSLLRIVRMEMAR